MEVQRQIEWGECDAAGIVFYPNFFKWMDATYHEWTRSFGFDQTSLMTDHNILGTPLIESVCRFKGPGRFYETLKITPKLERLGNTSLSLEYTFSIDARIIASGREVRGFVANQGKRLVKVPIPGGIRKALEEHIA